MRWRKRPSAMVVHFQGPDRLRVGAACGNQLIEAALVLTLCRKRFIVEPR